MNKNTAVLTFCLILFICHFGIHAGAQNNPKKKQVPRYDTIIVKHVTVTKSSKKSPVKPALKREIILPVPEFINQPYYYDRDGNKLIKLENADALMITKKKTLGLKGAKQFLSMADPSSKIRFASKNDIVFFIKTSGDVIDLTSYIKFYQFVPVDQKREVTVSSKEGLVINKEEEKGNLISFSVKKISGENYKIQFSQNLEAGEYGFVWVKNMELKEFTVFAFGIDWKSSD
ncbi:MAG: hypothetical protein H7096_03395 [Flavobacterium sp.]|nr:hypothetical protein [Pedobacter sp.]